MAYRVDVARGAEAELEELYLWVIERAPQQDARWFNGLEEAPDTYYVTDYYRPYPVMLVLLRHLNRDALHDLPTVSWRMALDRVRRPARRSGTRVWTPQR